MMKKVLSIACLSAMAVTAQASDNDEPVVYRDQVLSVPHGVVVNDDGSLSFYRDIRLEAQADGSFVLDAENLREGNLAMIDSVNATVNRDDDDTPGDDSTVSVAVAGNLSIPCVSLMDPMVERDGNTFGVILAESEPPIASCIQVLEPFETTVTLQAGDLEPGDYTVNVNGTEASFTLEAQ